jgi:hypothetical protein
MKRMMIEISVRRVMLRQKPSGSIVESIVKLSIEIEDTRTGEEEKTDGFQRIDLNNLSGAWKEAVGYRAFAVTSSACKRWR